MFGKSNNNVVKINCRKCGQPSDSDKFILDPVYKMMVCPNCARERKTSAAMRKPSQPSPAASSEPMIPGLSRASPNSIAAQQGRAAAQAAVERAQARGPVTPIGAAAQRRAEMEAKLFPSSVKQPPKEPEKKMPAGWDEDDIELERLARTKAASSSGGQQVERISDEKVKIGCAKCKYRFNYNVLTQTPSSCPNCGREVDKPRGY